MSPEEMQALLQRGKELGFGKEAVAGVLGMGRPLSQLAWVSSVDLGHLAQKTAMESMEEGRVIEYECFDSEWRPQGRGTIKLEKWDDAEKKLFTGRHGPSSDGYYAHYVKEQGEQNFLHHICDCEAKRCKTRKIRGDQRELVHIDRWRLMTPETMIGTGYLDDWGKQLGMELLDQKAQEQGPPKVPDAGSGLDAALARVEKEPDVGKGKPGAGKKRRVGSESPQPADSRKRSRSRKGRTESMEDFLAEKVKERKRARDERGGERKKKKKERSDSDESSSASSGTSSFHWSPARGGSDVWRLAQKKPGQLTKVALNEMTRYLADRQEAGEIELMGPKWRGQRVLAYLNQIMFVTHPPAKIGIRTARELQTLAIALDHLLTGQLPQATDILIQRLKALESSLQEGGWHTAKHLEIIPPQVASLTREDERELAAKNELKMLKLRSAVAKATKTK